MEPTVKNTRYTYEKEPRGANINASRLMRNPPWAEALIYAALLLLAAVTLVPMLNVVAQSLSPAHVIAKTPFMLWPLEPTVEAYNYIFETPALTRAFLTSVGITVIGTALSLLVTVLAAYGLSKTHVPGNK
ncbi:MAG: hypothetical protein GX558_07750, partial [Clostridiales bacterium]|nr:hypothetical protein [Clostridiales bacterium]